MGCLRSVIGNGEDIYIIHEPFLLPLHWSSMAIFLLDAPLLRLTCGWNMNVCPLICKLLSFLDNLGYKLCSLNSYLSSSSLLNIRVQDWNTFFRYFIEEFSFLLTSRLQSLPFSFLSTLQKKKFVVLLACCHWNLVSSRLKCLELFHIGILIISLSFTITMVHS